MEWLFGRRVASFDNGVLLASRLLLAWLFIHESVTLATSFGAAASGMAKIGVPPPLLVATIGLQFFGGIAIAMGYQARLAAAGLGLFCLATAFLFHMNFANRNELLHFEKDLAIAGGMFVLMIHGAGTWSIERLFRSNGVVRKPSETGFDVGDTQGVIRHARSPQHSHDHHPRLDPHILVDAGGGSGRPLRTQTPAGRAEER